MDSKCPPMKFRSEAHFLKEMSYCKTQLLSREPNYEAIAFTGPEGILFLVSLTMLHASMFRSILQVELYSNSFYSTYLADLSRNPSLSNIWRNSFIYTLIQSAVFFTTKKERNTICCVELLSSILKGVFLLVKIETCIMFAHDSCGIQKP